MIAQTKTVPRWLIPSVLGGGFFLLYLYTLAPDVVGHDAGEFQFVPYIFGIPHITGYPLQLIVGKAWSLLPLGSVAWRMNLLSAVMGAAAVAMTYLCGREVTGSRAASSIAAVAVGFAPLEWTWSTIAGVRAPATAFVAAVLLLALRWQSAVRANAPKLANGRFLWLAFLFGLALDHHRTILLLLPFLLVYVWLVCRQVFTNTQLLAKATGVAIAPLALYAILPLRAAFGAPWDQLNTATWQGFINLTVAGSDSGAHFDLTPAQALGRFPSLLQALAGSFSPLVLGLAAAGLIWLAFRREPAALLLTGYIVALGWLTLEWHLGPDLNLVYFMPAYVPLALLAAVGLQGVIKFAGRCERSQESAKGHQVLGFSQRHKEWLALGLNAVVLAAVAASGLYINRARFGPQPEMLDDFRVDLFQGHQARRLVDAFAQLPPNANVVGDWDQASALWYGQFVDGYNRGANISYPATTLPNVLRQASGPVFLATATVHPSAPDVTSVGPFVQVLAQPLTSIQADALPFGGTFGGEIQLAGVAPIRQPSYGVLPITLYWKAIRQPTADYSISVRLMPDAAHVATQRDEAAPVLGLSPTSRWQPGQVSADYYELDLRALTDGRYVLAVVLYEALPGGGFRNLSYDSSDRAVLGQLTLRRGSTQFTPDGGAAGV